MPFRDLRIYVFSCPQICFMFQCHVSIFRAKIIDVGAENLIVEFTGNHSKVNALIQRFTEEYEVLELARTGITGLGRGIENVTYIED